MFKINNFEFKINNFSKRYVAFVIIENIAEMSLRVSSSIPPLKFLDFFSHTSINMKTSVRMFRTLFYRTLANFSPSSLVYFAFLIRFLRNSQPLRFNRFRDAPNVNLFHKHDAKLPGMAALFFSKFSRNRTPMEVSISRWTAPLRLS